MKLRRCPTRTGAVVFQLAAVCLAGVAHIAFLPPFEGYDETAHWSYIQQLSDTGHIPVFGVDRLSADIDAYPGPRALANGQPYRAFALANATILAAKPGVYASGRDLNWEAQHPPLFYLIMVPVFRLAADLPWRWHMMALRLAAWALAFSGFAWGAIVTRRTLIAHRIEDMRLLIPFAWPCLFPEFFPELARLTNDSLCILLVACVWSLVLAWLMQGATIRRAVLLGL
jgi:hypothetical protein